VAVGTDGAALTWHHRIGPGTFTATAEVLSYSLQPRLFLRHHSNGERLIFTWEEPGRLQASTEPHLGFTNVPGASSPFVLTNFLPSKLFFRLIAEPQK
jgi:hypothetical protein